ncbi:MAG: hypothetical protein WAW79_11535 [Steroidobacteraceae bacterium]
MREERTTLLAGWGISDRFSVFARLHYSHRDLTEIDDGAADVSSASGIADPEIHGQARLWASGLDGDVGIRSSVYAVFGLKTAWGENNASRAGERLDEHVQPATGSTDWFAGRSASHQLNPRSVLFASMQYRHTGRNDSGCRYGRIRLLNLAYEHKLSARWDAVIEANFRQSDLDQASAGELGEPDTGGSITYLTPRILFDAGGGWVLRAATQIPLSNSGRNGHQDEGAVINVGISRLFGQ